MLGDVCSKLSHLDLFLKVSLEATKQHFSLSWLESIDDTGNRSTVVCIAEMDVLLVDKVHVPQLVGVVNHDIFLIVALQPLLSFVCLLLVENQVDCLVVILITIDKLEPMSSNLIKIFLGFLVCRCSEPFVVFDLPQLYVGY